MGVPPTRGATKLSETYKIPLQEGLNNRAKLIQKTARMDKPEEDRRVSKTVHGVKVHIIMLSVTSNIMLGRHTCFVTKQGHPTRI